ncbi:hypothetical protein MRX96_037501 [Rhipicephalus microplus]
MEVLRAQANLRETRNASHGTNADPSVRETPSQSRETPQTATTPGLQSSSTQLRVLHTTAQKIKQLPPLPPDGFKVVFRSQGGLDLTTLQPRYLLTALMQAAALTDPSTPTRRIHPVNNTCTVSAVNEKDALKLVQLQHITYDKHEYAMTAYIAPPDGSVRGVITNAYWKESPQELLADLISRNPHETILDARRMGLTRSILITFGQATVPRKIVYGGGLHLCTPYTPRVETCSNCRTIGRRTDVCIQPRTHRCPRCGQLHPKEANPTCTPVCIICEGPHLSGTRECKHRHLPKVTRPKSPREPRSQEGVDHSLRGASTKRSEPHAGQRKGQSKSSDQPTWADKLKTPNGTRPPATNTPPAPDPRDQELRALRVESNHSAAPHSQRLGKEKPHGTSSVPADVLRNTPSEISVLTGRLLVLGPISAKLLKALDKIVRASVRTWLSLPHDVSIGFLYVPIPVGGLGLMCLRFSIPYMKTYRVDRLLYSDHYQCTVAVTKDFIRKALRQAQNLTQFGGDVFGSVAAARKYWTRNLHSNFDGRPLSQCPTAPGSMAWLGEGTTFLKGIEFIDLANFHIATISNLTCLTWPVHLTTQSRWL